MRTSIDGAVNLRNVTYLSLMVVVDDFENVEVCM